MLQKLLNRFDYLNHLIRTQKTGTPVQLAGKLGISQRTWYKLRDELVNEVGVPLRYCPYRKTYYYEEDGELVFAFRRKKLPESEREKLTGGYGLRSAEVQQNYFAKSWPLH